MFIFCFSVQSVFVFVCFSLVATTKLFPKVSFDLEAGRLRFRENIYKVKTMCDLTLSGVFSSPQQQEQKPRFGIVTCIRYSMSQRFSLTTQTQNTETLCQNKPNTPTSPFSLVLQPIT